jgi:hypothetical protein
MKTPVCKSKYLVEFDNFNEPINYCLYTLDSKGNRLEVTEKERNLYLVPMVYQFQESFAEQIIVESPYLQLVLDCKDCFVIAQLTIAYADSIKQKSSVLLFYQNLKETLKRELSQISVPPNSSILF